MTPITLQGLVVQFSACYDLPYSRVEILRKILMTIFFIRKEKRDLHRFQHRYMCIKGAIEMHWHALVCHEHFRYFFLLRIYRKRSCITHDLL